MCVLAVPALCVLFAGPMAKWNANALAALKGKLKSNITMIELSDMLVRPAGGFMNAAEALSVTAKTGDVEQVGQIIKILQGKGDEDFATFCRMLRQCNYKAWARELELTAERFKTSEGILPLLSLIKLWKTGFKMSYTVNNL